jgi:hypothetical protein
MKIEEFHDYISYVISPWLNSSNGFTYQLCGRFVFNRKEITITRDEEGWVCSKPGGNLGEATPTLHEALVSLFKIYGCLDEGGYPDWEKYLEI